MTRKRIFLWIAAMLAAPFVLMTLWLALFGWNWLRGPIEHWTEQKTGRELVITGDLSVHLGWPWPRMQADAVAFANPPWARERQMVTARVRLGQLTLDHGVLGYDDVAAKTHIRAEMSTTRAPPDSSTAAADPPGTRFQAKGHYRGLPLEATGTGGPVLALRFETAPYPLNIDTTIGRTRIQAQGTVTGLVSLSAVNMNVAVRGDSLEQLYPLFGIPAPATRQKKVLPDVAFKTDRWTSMDADVRLRAQHLRRTTAWSLNDLSMRVTLQDGVLTLDPLDVGMAGGHVLAQVSLDGSNQPIRAKAKAQVRKVSLSGLFPKMALNQASIGQINGAFTLSGSGSSIAGLLATSNGHVGLGVGRGEVSQLMMEKAGLHLWEILRLAVTGDKRIALRCAVASFSVRNGVMHADTLFLDTAVTTLIGTGQVDLAQETLALTLNQKTKNTSPLALRSPIYVRGSFDQPKVGVDKGRVAARALGALALGLANPALALVPLVDPGPGKDSDCGRLADAPAGR